MVMGSNKTTRADNHRLVFLFDIPHCYKNLRNQLLDKVFSVKINVDVNRVATGIVKWYHIRKCLQQD